MEGGMKPSQRHGQHADNNLSSGSNPRSWKCEAAKPTFTLKMDHFYITCQLYDKHGNILKMATYIIIPDPTHRKV